MSYHYGQTIREYREKKQMTIVALAEQWPSKEHIGVTRRYVSDIERGVQHIQDISTLRELARLLDIPLWKLGLSEYNPFQEEPDVESFFNLDSLHELIEDTWYIRLTPLPITLIQTKIEKMYTIFYSLIKIDHHITSSRQFMRLYAQALRLKAVLLVEQQHYTEALALYHAMLEIGKELQDDLLLSFAYSRIGVELLRTSRPDALPYLTTAKDISLSQSKELIGFSHAMLARGYARFGNIDQFNKTIAIAINYSQGMQGQHIVTKDFIYHSFSGILEEKSNGLWLLRQKGMIDIIADIEKNIALEQHDFLKMWMPLEHAQAYLLENEVEESIRELNGFYDNISEHGSKHVLQHAKRHIDDIIALGYSNVSCVKNFQEMIG